MHEMIVEELYMSNLLVVQETLDGGDDAVEVLVLVEPRCHFRQDLGLEVSGLRKRVESMDVC